MLNPADILEKAQKNVERQIVLLKEELKAESSSKAQGRQNGSIPDLEEFNRKLNKKIEDAPKDSKQYARKNGSWVEVQGGSGGSSLTVLTCPVITSLHNIIPTGKTPCNATQLKTCVDNNIPFVVRAYFVDEWGGLTGKTYREYRLGMTTESTNEGNLYSNYQLTNIQYSDSLSMNAINVWRIEDGSWERWSYHS